MFDESMTVGELIKRLRQFHPTAQVRIAPLIPRVDGALDLPRDYSLMLEAVDHHTSAVYLRPEGVKPVYERTRGLDCRVCRKGKHKPTQRPRR